MTAVTFELFFNVIRAYHRPLLQMRFTLIHTSFRDSCWAVSFSLTALWQLDWTFKWFLPWLRHSIIAVAANGNPRKLDTTSNHFTKAALCSRFSRLDTAGLVAFRMSDAHSETLLFPMILQSTVRENIHENIQTSVFMMYNVGVRINPCKIFCQTGHVSYLYGFPPPVIEGETAYIITTKYLIGRRHKARACLLFYKIMLLF